MLLLGTSQIKQAVAAGPVTLLNIAIQLPGKGQGGVLDQGQFFADKLQVSVEGFQGGIQPMRFR